MSTQITKLLAEEIKQEASLTRKLLEIVPEDKYAWRPHKKSMTLQALSTHIVEIAQWIKIAISTEGIDFSEQPAPIVVRNNADLLSFFNAYLQESLDALSGTTDEFIIEKTWTMSMGSTLIAKLTKYETIRHSIAQAIHHRAQLGVYLRLLDVPLPGIYGPSADDDKGY